MKTLQQAQSQSIELEARLSATPALGILLTRAAGHPKLLNASQRQQVLDVLSGRLRKEVTRLSSIDAIDSIAVANAPINIADCTSPWLQSPAIKLANQPRKSDRTLSSNSLSARFWARISKLSLTAWSSRGEDVVPGAGKKGNGRHVGGGCGEKCC